MGNGEDASHTYIHVNIVTGIPGAVTVQSVSSACLKQKGFLFEAIISLHFSVSHALPKHRISYSYQCLHIWQSSKLQVREME